MDTNRVVDKYLDVRLVANAARREAADYWSEHPKVPLQAWLIDVAADETRLGYWEYVAFVLLHKEENWIS